MFDSRGISFSDIGDIEVFAHGDDLHLFHLTLPNHDVVQHLVSQDGLSWTKLKAAIRTGDPGDCDDDQIWTMSVSEHEGRFYMLYTALAYQEDGRVQRNALAVSDDLVHWEKFSTTAVAEADPQWYETAADTLGMVSWRDPKPVKVGDRWYATVNAREKHGPFMRRGATGLMTSIDLQRWEVQPPLFAPRRWWDLECPQVFAVDSRYYLTSAIMEDGTQRYWMADAFEGPYQVPPDGGILAPAGHYAGRVITWRGETLFCCWHEPRPRKRDGQPLPRADWHHVRNIYGKFLVPPLELKQAEDGSLVLHTFSGWAAYSGTPAPLIPASTTSIFNQPIADTWRVLPPTGSTDLLLSTEDAGDFRLEGEITLDAIAGGIAFRMSDDTAGYYLTLRPGSTIVSLHKWLQTRDALDGRPWFDYVALQEAELRTPIASNRTYHVQLLNVGNYIEFSLDGVVLLATLSGERTSGKPGIWSESGTIAADSMTLALMTRPDQA